VLERHQKMQEEVAEDMVKLARSLKKNAIVAKEIIKNDNQVGVVIILNLYLASAMSLNIKLSYLQTRAL
jgi:hypothetical protein